MQMYAIFWIKDEFAHHYFYKVDLLNQFLKSVATDRQDALLAMQVREITHCFDADAFLHHIYSQLHCGSHVQVDDNQITIYSDKHFITLHIEKNQIKFLCQTLTEAESLLFPLLRSFHPFFVCVGL
ncbi:sporulation inhibitor of replication protein SirA [Virgibacillus halophilus]|uniref:Sporulation inhibitor of replication protein SirA n=1 Tax=Tigheibacillus halophilus TaxID=361280 RepID=A0ABU5CAU7_9BACI|nr:sporulation inhibitor of replication protein SirA [Virgibacillus halophilus]